MVLWKHIGKVSLIDVEVFEYGFSIAVLNLCKQEWKRSLKDAWYDVLCNIIVRHSDTSFLLHENTFHDRSQLCHDMQVQEEKLFYSMSIDVKNLYPLRTIYIIYMGNKTVLSKISKEQQDILDKYHIEIGDVCG